MSVQHNFEVKVLEPKPGAPGNFNERTISDSSFIKESLSQGLTLYFLSSEEGELPSQVQNKLSTAFSLPQYLWEKKIHRGHGLYLCSNSTSTFRLFVKQVNAHDWANGVKKHYKWYEMSFHCIKQDGGKVAIICFDVLEELQVTLKDAVRRCGSDRGAQDWFLSGQAILVHWLIDLYDDSVWGIRDVVREIEKKRDGDNTGAVNFSSLHDVSRHALHVSETLKISEDVLEAHVTQLEANYMIPASTQAQISTNVRQLSPAEALQHLQFSTHRLKALKHRSDANEARLRNEISLAFNLLAQQDTKSMLSVSSSAKEDSTAMRRVAFVTLLFLPATFVSTIFSTTFFNFDPHTEPVSEQWRISQRFWIYWVVTIPLTALTWVAWHYLQRNLDAVQKAGARKSSPSRWRQRLQEFFEVHQDTDQASLKANP